MVNLHDQEFYQYQLYFLINDLFTKDMYICFVSREFKIAAHELFSLKLKAWGDYPRLASDLWFQASRENHTLKTILEKSDICHS